MNSNNPNHGPQTHSKQRMDKHSTPENKDNLDSRKNLEINDESEIHNKKQVHDGEKDENNETRGDDPKYNAPG